MDLAPNFPGSGYPGKGKIIGPAWLTIWNMLTDGRWRTVDEIAEAVPEVARRTVETLLVEAQRAGVLESTVRRSLRIQNRRRRFYRRA